MSCVPLIWHHFYSFPLLQDSDHCTDSDSGISDTENVGSPCSDRPTTPGSASSCSDRPSTPEDVGTEAPTEGDLVDLLGVSRGFYGEEMMEVEEGTELPFSGLEDDLPYPGVQYGPEIPDELVQVRIH